MTAKTAMHRVVTSSSREVSSDGVRQLILAYKAKGSHGAVAEDWKPRPGFLYTVCRAISARINQNFDAWPSEELKKSYRTFIGKPIFVNHQNHDPTKARGKVIAARYIENGDDKYIETIMEVDAQRFPKLAKEIRDGGLDSVSMGVEAGFTICSACGNKAYDEPEFCDHVRNHKGHIVKVKNKKTGKTEDRLVYEDCFKLGFFELSYVFDPADETAVVSRVMMANNRTAAGCPPGSDNCADGGMSEMFLPKEQVTEDQNIVIEPEAPQAVKNPNYRFPEATGRGVGGGSSSSGGGHSHGGGGTPDDDGILPQSRALYDAVLADHPDITDVHGYRVDSYGEHSQGALDFMTTDNDVAQSIIQKSFEHGAPWSIWRQQMYYPDGRIEDMPDRGDPTQNHMDHVHTGPLRAARRRRRHAFGETEVPEDIDTLRDDENDSLDDYQFVEPVGIEDDSDTFQHWLDSPPELSGPNFDRVRWLDNAQEAAGLDEGRLVENFDDGTDPDFEDSPPRRMTMARTRTAAPRKRAADDENEALEVLEEVVGEDLDGDNEEGESEEHRDLVEGDEDEDDDEEAEDGEVLQVVEVVSAERNAARRRSARSQRRTRKKGQPQKGQSAMSLADRAKVASKGRRQHHADTSGHTDGGPYGRNDQGEQEEVFLSQTPGTETVEAPDGDSKITNTENNLVASIRAKSAELQRDLRNYQQLKAYKRAARRPYRQTADFVATLPPRQRVAAARQFCATFKAENPRFSPRKFFVAAGLDPRLASAPTMQRRAKSPIGREDLLRYVQDSLGEYAGEHNLEGIVDELSERVLPARARGNPADFFGSQIPEDEYWDVVRRHARRRRGNAVEQPVKHDPALSGTDEQSVKGQDFDDVALDNVETQPKDASKRAFTAFKARPTTVGAESVHDGKVKYFDTLTIFGEDDEEVAAVTVESSEDPEPYIDALRAEGWRVLDSSGSDWIVKPDNSKDASKRAFAAFDAWLRSATGRTASQHNPEWLRRQASRWASHQGINVAVLYPALGNALRQARKGKAPTGKAAAMNRTADESLEVAAPDARVDVEAPVKNVTDADAQASQYDLHDFGDNAGDDIADPELSSDSQIWAPGEGDKTARKASGVSTVRYAEAYIKAGLAPESDKWKLARQAETMRESVVVDRTKLLEAVAAANAQRASKTAAAVSRGPVIPRGLTAPTRTSATRRVAANDPVNDSALFF